MENNYSMLLIWLFPLISGVIGFYLGKKNKTTRNDWVDIVMFVEWIMLGCMGYQIAREWSTLEMTISDFFGMGLLFEMNIIRLVLCVVVTTAFTVVSQFMKESMKEEKGSNRFYLLYMSVYSMLMGAVLTPSVFNLVMFVSVALLLLYPMIMHRQDQAAVRNAGIYLAYAIATMVLFMVSLVIVLGHIGAVDFEVMYAAAMINGMTKTGVLGGILLLMVFAIYAGMFPVQFLVTRGASNGLMEGSVILSSVVSKLGVYGIMLIVSTIFSGNTILGDILLGVAVLSTIWGLLVTFSSTDVRRILMGLDLAVNGFNILGIALIPLVGEMSQYATRGSAYMLVSSSLSLTALYMVALELVRKCQTFEIKGLIASGKGKKLLMVGCFMACASLLGLPGTMGYFGFSMMFYNVFHTLGWKWMIGLFAVLWAFFMTAVSRVFMKFFVSKKDETVLILSTAEEISGTADHLEQEGAPEEEPKENEVKGPYRFGEVLLILVGAVQVAIGVAPSYTLDKIADYVDDFFYNANVVENVAYYDVAGVVTFVVTAILAILLYVNLVHGILLRAIRNKKNKELKERNEVKE